MDSELYISYFKICSTLNDKILSHNFFNFSQISFVCRFACVCVCEFRLRLELTVFLSFCLF